MKAIAVSPGKPGPALIDIPEPKISSDTQVKLRVIRVGICGTDREEAAGGRALAPKGQSTLVIGHEMLGRVVETGKAVTRLKSGDLAVCTVRRGCGQCLPCAMNRADMCLTGSYLERGIWGMDGYQAGLVVDSEQYMVRVPEELAGVGVLTEPLSVAEKAIDEAVRIQAARLPESASRPYWLYGRRCLVAGLGPIGLLAALCLRLRGAEVYGLDVVDAGTSRPRWLERIGGVYVDARKVPPSKVDNAMGGMELILEAAGVASLELNLLDALSRNGVYVLTGIPGGDRPLSIQGAELVRRLVLENQLMVGSVNASRDHYQMAVDDMEAAERRWPGLVREIITTRVPAAEFPAVFSRHDPAEIKAVIEWSPEKERS